MNPLYEFEDIEDYLQDRMSTSDRAAFEQALETDPDLVQRVEALRAESKVLRMLRNEHLLAQLDDWSKEEIPEKKTLPKASGRRPSIFSKRLLLLFLGLLLVGFAITGKIMGWFENGQVSDNQPVVSLQPDTSKHSTPVIKDPPIANNTNPVSPKKEKKQAEANNVYATLADNSFVEEDFSQTLMGGDEGNAESRYEQAVKLYGAMQYKKALKLLEPLDKNQEQEFRYLRGYTYYHLGQYAKAEADFRAFRGYASSDRKLDAVWCEVFCLTKQLPGSRSRLDTVLKEILANPKHAYYDRAKALEMGLLKQK